MAWTSVDAYAAGGAFVAIDLNGARLLVDSKSLEWTGLYAGVVVTLSTQMRHLQTREVHEDPNHRSLRPDSPFMLEGTGDFAEATSTTFGEVSGDPYLRDNSWLTQG